jgi:hypothetical protein
MLVTQAVNALGYFIIAPTEVPSLQCKGSECLASLGSGWTLPQKLAALVAGWLIATDSLFCKGYHVLIDRHSLNKNYEGLPNNWNWTTSNSQFKYTAWWMNIVKIALKYTPSFPTSLFGLINPLWLGAKSHMRKEVKSKMKCASVLKYTVCYRKWLFI